jgi:hypothetical protein
VHDNDSHRAGQKLTTISAAIRALVIFLLITLREMAH